MKRFFSFIGAALLLLGLTGVEVKSAETATSKTDTNATKEVKALVRKVQTKLQDRKDKESDFEPELKEFETLITKFQKNAPEAAAEAAFMRALLYVQVFENTTKGTELMQGVRKDFATTKFGAEAERVLGSMERQAAAKKVADALTPGAKFPDFNETDINGKPFSLAGQKGKVVLVDFWATWCGPCRAELPNVLSTYEKYHGKGFEILGISLDEEKSKLQDFVKDKKMTWAQYFDGKGWENKLAQNYGVTSIPATYLIDGEGKIIAKDLRGEELSAAVAKALEKK